jgi:23S rRNA pseudouridine2605 synthase
LNKPQGVLSEVSPEEPRQTVRDLVPIPGHMFIVGRLDMESEGLILLTNDGELANRLSHPRYGHEKEYRVLVGARPDDRQLDAWKHGIVLEDGYRTAPAQVRVDSLAGKGAWLQVILREGRKRQIREMGKQTGLPVLRILRIRIGSLLLGDLKPGVWRELRQDEVRALKVNKTYREPGRGAGRAPRQAERSGRRKEESGGNRTVERGETPRQTVHRPPGERPRRGETPRSSHTPPKRGIRKPS